MTKDELIAKYWKKRLPGADGYNNAKFLRGLEKEWQRDNDNQKIKKKDLDDLLSDLKQNGK